MASFSASLSHLNVFSTINKSNVHVACKGNYQLFVSDGNVVRTALVDEGKNYFKLLRDSTDFAVKDLKVNRLETLLAIIGDDQIKIVSIRSQPSFVATSIWWETKSMQLGQIQGHVVAASWHPAMSNGSTLVVLTSVGIFVYDVATSLQTPARSIKFGDKMPKFVGFCFGLVENFAGSMTLYLQAESGALFAIYPFLAHNLPILASKELVTEFLGECAEVLAKIEKKFAPSFVANSRLAEILRQMAFAEFFAVQLQTPAISDLNGDVELQLHHNAEIFDDVIQGPVANVGPLDDIRLVPTNSRVLVLCAVKGGDKVTFHYLAQLKPLFAAYSKPGVLEKPHLPAQKETIRKDQKYRPLARGFGFVVESDDDDVETETTGADEYAEAVQSYNSKLEKYNLEVKLSDFVKTNFGDLTILAKDVMAGKSDVKASFADSQSPRLTVSTGCDIIVADTTDAITNIWSDFQVAYTKHKTHKTIAHFQLEDKVRNSGEYAIAISEGHSAQIFGLTYKEGTRRLQVFAADSAKLSSPVPSSSSAEIAAIQSQLATKQPVRPQVPKLDLTSPGTLKFALKTRQEMASAFKEATMLLFKFQDIAQTQYNELQNQLESVAKQTKNLAKGSHFDGVTTRIENLLERLEQLRSRQNKIITSTEKKIKGIHAYVSLPLSDEERAWFKELNLLSAAISGSPESIEAQFENVKNRFDQNVKVSSNKNSKSEIGEERRLLSGPFLMLKRSLEAQSKAISNLKSQASELTVVANEGILTNNLTSIE